MGLDYGEKTVGVAVSDPLGITAQGVEIIRREKENHLRSTLRRLLELITGLGVDRIVVGYPKHLNNTAGDRARKSEEFAHLLETKTGLPVFLWDERLTTVEADRTLMMTGVKKEDRGKYIDEIAAVLILQGYMDAQKTEELRSAGENG